MQWVRNNKFLAGFIVAMAVGAGVFGFLLFSAQAHHAQVDQDYNAGVTELKRLQGLKLYPDEANLHLYEEQKDAYKAAVTALQSKLAAMEPAPEKPLSPTDFQNRLREVVRGVLQAAQQVGVGLPEGFYLGFEQYRETLPDAAATPLLTRQLTAIEEIVRVLIKQRIDRLTYLKRAPLAQEIGGATAAAAGAPASGAGKPAASPAPSLITRQSIEMEFAAAPSAFRETLNDLTQAPHLYVVRAVQVKNQVDKGPPRVVSGDADLTGGTRPPTSSPPPPAVGPNGVPDPQLPEKGPPPLRYVVGQEKLNVIARIELTKVAPPR